MKIDTMAPLVDTKPLYEALAELKDQRGLYSKAAKRFLLAKLKKSVKELRDTAKHLEGELHSYRADQAEQK
jgi:hypothetical protein